MATIAAPEQIDEQLEATWSRPAGIVGWLSQVNHKAIGVRFIVTAFVFFGLAGILALLMRIQLMFPDNRFLHPDLYNQFFTMHGTTMMFLFAIPVVEGVGMYLVPLMVGSRDLAFPRLNAFGYWVFLLAGVTLFFGLFTGQAPDGAWFNYPPLVSEIYRPGLGIDYWATTITFLEIAALVAAVEIIVTILKLRAPGMTLSRMPLFCWAMLVTSFMIIFAMPTVMLASVMLAADRMIGTHFFNAAAGGDPLLWQHLFWFFAHPEVYIIFVPALGMVAMIIEAATRRPVVAYTLVVVATVAIGFFSFGLWVHHMFTVGIPDLSLAFFAAASYAIALPSGVQIFAWIATIWGTRPAFTTPFLYVLGFFIIFVLGGITGVMVASIPFTDQVHDTYFVVAHFHYVIIGGLVFPLIGAVYFWFPKVTGKLMSERLGRWSFWMLLAGFNLTFFPMHILGIMGMPRQVYTYRPGLGWDGLNLFISLAAFLIASSLTLTTFNLVRSYFRGAPAPANPWGAGTLEWSVPSPPPQYNFREIPFVESRYPLWGATQRGPAPSTGVSLASGFEVGADDDRRESAGTGMLDADVNTRLVLAGPSIWPMIAAIAVGVAVLGSVFSLWLIPIGVTLAYIAFVIWLWPENWR